MKKHFLFLAPLVLTGLLACSPPHVEQSVDSDANVAHVTAKAVEHLTSNLRAPLDLNKPILVATVADINDLDGSSTLGRLISEQVAVSLGRDGYDVTEIRLGSGLRFNKDGEFILTRDVRKLAHRSNDAQAVVTGTYAMGTLYVNVILKVVRLSDGKIVGTASYGFPNGPNTQSLASGAEGTTAVVGQ